MSRNFQISADQVSTSSSHSLDDLLALKLPDRTWKEFIVEGVRKAGLGAAMMGAGLGVGGFGGIEEKKAEAGIMLNGSDPAVYAANGAAQTVKNGGHAMYANIDYTFQNTNYSILASGIGFNRNGQGWMLGTAHYDYVRVNGNGTIRFGTGTDAVSDPGNQYTMVRAFTHTPGYGQDIWPTAPDLTIYQLNNQLTRADGSLVGDLIIANSRPVAGEVISWAGYGVRSFLDGTQFSPAGTAQAGLARVRSFTISSQFDTSLYFSTSLPPSLVGGLGINQSDSNSVAMNSAGEIVGSAVGLGSGAISFFNDFTNPINRNYINSITSVPEPSSILLASLAVGGAFAGRMFTNRKKSEVNS